MSAPSTSDSETISSTDTLQEMVAVLETLLSPMHFLNDLNAVWDKLSEEVREEITSARVFQEKDHEKLIQAGLTKLQELTERLRGFKYRGVRKNIKQYIAHWKTFEPDQVKILQAQIRKHLE